MTIFWHWTGPLVKYEGGFLHIEVLNPEMKTKWRMSRSAMLRFGWRSIISAFRP
jgi:hypothetical protein